MCIAKKKINEKVNSIGILVLNSYSLNFPVTILRTGCVS